MFLLSSSILCGSMLDTWPAMNSKMPMNSLSQLLMYYIIILEAKPPPWPTTTSVPVSLTRSLLAGSSLMSHARVVG